MSSRDNLSTTISQEMQDLLTSIQSLGNTDETGQGTPTKGGIGVTGTNARPDMSKQSSPGKMQECTLREKNVDFESLMKEVENQIRFSVTAELLERMANCPSIENYFLSGINNLGQDNQSTSMPDKIKPPTSEPTISKEQCTEAESCNNENDTFLGSPPIPDLLQATVKQPTDRLASAHFYNKSPPRQMPSSTWRTSPPQTVSTTPRGVTSPPTDNSKKRFTSLPRPSDMSGVTRYNVPAGKVPDMWSRVQCSEDTCATDETSDDGYTGMCSDLSKVRNDIDNLCDIINDSSDKLKQELTAAGTDSQRSSGKFNRKIEKDLRDTQNVMKDIEHTVDSFRRHLSLPSGKVSFIWFRVGHDIFRVEWLTVN